MEASDQTQSGGQDETGADPAPAAPDPAPASQNQPPAQEPEEKDPNRQYTITTSGLKLDLSSAAAKKESIEQLTELAKATEGQLTVYARIGRVMAPNPKAALRNLGGLRDLDGDYDVIADGARNSYQNVTSKMERNVSIG